MSNRKKGPKANIQGARPEPPPFIARMREQIVANEDAERRERSEKRRRVQAESAGQLAATDGEDAPRVVKINQDDLTEEEYKRMKLELETQYKLEQETKTSVPVELDIDAVIQIGGQTGNRLEQAAAREMAPASSKDQQSDSSNNHEHSSVKSKSAWRAGPSSTNRQSQSLARSQTKSNKSKKLSYGSSSSEESDD